MRASGWCVAAGEERERLGKRGGWLDRKRRWRCGPYIKGGAEGKRRTRRGGRGLSGLG
jgi:putative component of membrane protein insertase Oxa1/YidC/SpoIIIJ protein YidD